VWQFYYKISFSLYRDKIILEKSVLRTWKNSNIFLLSRFEFQKTREQWLVKLKRLVPKSDGRKNALM
jgi:hypothetical protein